MDKRGSRQSKGTTGRKREGRSGMGGNSDALKYGELGARGWKMQCVSVCSNG